MPQSDIEYLNGFLQAFKFVNCKADHGLEYYLRDMQMPYLGLELPYDPTCIQSCFEKQLAALNNSTVAATYRDSSWQQVLVALNKWLYLYLNDSVKLTDPTSAFSLSNANFRVSVAEKIQQQMQATIGEAAIQIAENGNADFLGYVFLLDADSKFYELRLGTHY